VAGHRAWLVKPLFVPSPQAVVKKFFQIWNEGFTNTPFLEHVLISTAGCSGPFFWLAYRSAAGSCDGDEPADPRHLRPADRILPPDPAARLLPLMIIWFGIGETSKVLLIFLSVFAPIVLGARSGVKSAAIEQIHAAYSFGATRWQVMRHVILPSAMPEILTAMRVGIGFGWTTLVAAEMVAATKGLGYMVLSASQFLQTPTVIMGIFVIAIIAFAFDLLMRFLERRSCPGRAGCEERPVDDLPEASHATTPETDHQDVCATWCRSMLARIAVSMAKRPCATIPATFDKWEGDHHRHARNLLAAADRCPRG
jgi:taurine transport system permease protein